MSFFRVLVVLQVSMILMSFTSTVSSSEFAAPDGAPEGAPVGAPEGAQLEPLTKPVAAQLNKLVSSHAPVYAPVAAPVAAPVKAPVAAPVKAPVAAPVKAPVAAPVAAPVKAPVASPIYKPLRKPVAVQGVVYCKSCNNTRHAKTLNGASPLPGATVRLVCRNSRRPRATYKDGKTDKNGYFFIQAMKSLTTYGTHKCKVFLLHSPLASCNNATDLYRGVSGAILRLTKQATPTAFSLFTVGPFAYGPTYCPKA